MNIITISFVGILILQAINDIYLYTQMDKSVLNHFQIYQFLLHYKIG